MTKTPLLPLFLLLLLSSSIAHAEPAQTRWDLIEENDIFRIIGPKADASYTQGLKISRTNLITDGLKHTETFSLGQNIYTPADKHNPNISPNDRPYAGYLYGEFKESVPTDTHTETTASLQLGVIGPAAGGDEVQSGFHKAIGQSAFDGWANQLKNEPTANLLVEQRYKYLLLTLPFPLNDIDLDLIPGLGGDLGNVLTDVKANALLRFGKLAPNFGPSQIFPREALTTLPKETTATLPSPKQNDSLYYYVFAGTEGRAIAQNIFLDGNTFQSSHRVTKEPLVADLKFGISLQYHQYHLSFTETHVTSEWKDKYSAHNFGSIDLAYGW